MLDKLPESFLLHLADIDPVVGMVSKKLYNVCGGSFIDVWKFLTYVTRYNLILSQTIDNFNIHTGIKCVACAKIASGDHMLVNSICEYDMDVWREDIMYVRQLNGLVSLTIFVFLNLAWKLYDRNL
jgi:hypothetical protein